MDGGAGVFFLVPPLQKKPAPPPFKNFPRGGGQFFFGKERLDHTGNMSPLQKKAVPAVHLKCFTGVEIHYFADKYGMTYAETLSRLKAAGLDSMPGGGAEIFHPE